MIMIKITTGFLLSIIIKILSSELPNIHVNYIIHQRFYLVELQVFRYVHIVQTNMNVSCIRDRERPIQFIVGYIKPYHICEVAHCRWNWSSKIIARQTPAQKSLELDYGDKFSSIIFYIIVLIYLIYLEILKEEVQMEQ